MQVTVRHSNKADMYVIHSVGWRALGSSGIGKPACLIARARPCQARPGSMQVHGRITTFPLLSEVYEESEGIHVYAVMQSCTSHSPCQDHRPPTAMLGISTPVSLLERVWCNRVTYMFEPVIPRALYHFTCMRLYLVNFVSRRADPRHSYTGNTTIDVPRLSPSRRQRPYAHRRGHRN